MRPEPPNARASGARRSSWIVAVAALVLGAPTLLCSYLPMTDLPQHVAIASILQSYADPAFDFSAYYTLDIWRSPYLLPYALALLLGKVAPIAAAMRVVAFLSVIAYPLGALALLRAAGKPPSLALLSFPLAYNRAFFWGFINQNLSVGLALVALSFYVDPKKSHARDGAQALVILALVFSHVYGLALLLGLFALWVLATPSASRRRALFARPSSLLAPALGVALWLWLGRSAEGYDKALSPPFGARLADLPTSILGGYRDPSELVLLALLGAAFVVVSYPSLPINRRRWSDASPIERVAYASLAANLVLYFTLPQATMTAKFIHFRHAFLAVALVPLGATTAGAARLRSLAAAVSVSVVAAAATLNAYAHLFAFDREARAFDAIRAAAPPRARIVALTFDPHGRVMVTNPYLHFAAYIQAEKGGLLAMTFPRVFWNLPVRARAADTPPTPVGLEWDPGLFDEGSFGHYYDHVVVRSLEEHRLSTSPEFPFELVAVQPPWQLYRRVSPRRGP